MKRLMPRTAFEPFVAGEVERPGHAGYTFASQTVCELERFAHEYGVHECEIALAVVAALVQRYSGEARPAIATADAAEKPRKREVDLTSDPSLLAFLAAASGAGDASLEALTALVWETRESSPTAVALLLPPVELRLTFRRTDALVLDVEGRGERFDGPALERLAGHLEMLLSGALREPARGLSSLPIITAAERDRQAAWNDTRAAYRRDCSLVDVLHERALANPAATAVEFAGASLTYCELDAAAEQLATRLRVAGVGRDVLVALHVERSLEMIVAVLGILRAGGAYVPLDPSHPAERIAFMLADSDAAVVVTQERLRATLPPHRAQVVVVDAPAPVAAASLESRPPPASRVEPTQLAYVIYTSGSTGRPKGVQIEHRSVVNFLRGLAAIVRPGPGDTLLAVAPLAFDISGLDIYLTLTSGARLIVAPREAAASPPALMELIERSGVTYMQATPSTWRMLVDAGWRGSARLTILCGGEALSQTLAELLLERCAHLFNLYGPTEATIWATMQRVRAGEPVSIGRPLANVTAYVLNAALQPQPVGIAGELYLGGDGLARGYLRRPELTAQRFLPAPFGSGERLYRTGDLARFAADGSLEFIGRADFQVKLRGHRIELGEIEAVLGAMPGVGSAVVVVRDDAGGEPQLAAYVTADRDATLSPLSLRRGLATSLPAYMVPDAITLVETLPLNVNGKVDRGRLPAPHALRERELVLPRSALETRLIELWEDVLGIRPIGVTDDFFELGATSIAAARLFDRIERELGAKLPLSPLFAAPTIAKLAELIGRGGAAERYSSLVPIRTTGSRTPIFCVHGGAGTILHFHALARHLGDEQPFYGLQMQGLYGDAPVHLRVETMAAHYVREIVTVQPQGPYVIAGYCFGGIVAFEMARLLERRGQRVALLITLNAPSSQYLRAFRRKRTRRWKLAQLPVYLGTRLWCALRRPLPDAWREAAIFLVCLVAETRYRATSVAAPMLLIRGAGLYRTSEPDLGWKTAIAGGVAACEVPGRHADHRQLMHEPHVERVARRIERALARLWSTHE